MDRESPEPRRGAPRLRTPSDYLRERLHDRKFVTTGNPHGVSGADTVFHYRVDGPIITATYQGGRIRAGHVIARATGPDTIETLYHSITTDGELLSGWSRGHVGVDSDGRTTLAFEWGWLSGAEGGGQSQYVEQAAGGKGPSRVDTF
jgi:hypothetical protein